MKFALRTALLLLLPGIAASAQAQPGRGQGEHRQESAPRQQQQRPMQQQQRPMQQQQRPRQQEARPEQQQRQVSHAVPAAQRMPPDRPEHRAEQNHARAEHSPSATQSRDHGEHGRITNAHYSSRFGREHSFHVNRRDYDHRRFRYGGYAFGFVDSWPVGWGYSDDVYVVYGDDGYYMYNRFHPGLRISLNIL